MKWILIIAWASNGTGFTMQEFESQVACQKAAIWSKENSWRGAARFTCINSQTGENVFKLETTGN